MSSPTVAVPFIVFNDETKKYEVASDAIRILEALPDTLGVVVVAGRYRSGKSFLMNQLVRANVQAGEGFGIGHTVASHTKGIWMWPIPVRATTSSGETIDVIVMDSEGLGATEASEHRDTEIFSLSTLLCSVLIFNCSRTIDEVSIQSLGFIANLTKHIRLRASSGDATGAPAAAAREETLEEYQHFLPSFVWTIRDFALQLEDGHGPDDYMETALAQQPGFDKETTSRNRIRKAVTTFFTDRKCVTLVVPMDNESKLQSLDTMPESALRPLFREQMDELRAMLFRHARSKSLNGRPVNGLMLVALANSYVQAINSNAVPNIGDAWESAAKSQCEKSVRDCVRQYEASLTPGTPSCVFGSLPVDEVILHDAHLQSLNTVFGLYDRLAPSVHGVTQTYRAKIETAAKSRFAELLKDNVTASRTAAESLWRDLRKQYVVPCVESIRASLGALATAEPTLDSLARASAENSMGQLWTMWFSLKEEYLKRGVGPASMQALLSTAMERFKSDVLDVSHNLDAATQSLLKRALAAVAKEQDAAAATKDALAQKEGEVASANARVGEALKQATAAKDELSSTAAELLALKSSFGASKSETDSLRADIKRLSDQAAVQSAALSEAQADLSQTKRDRDAVSRKLEAVQASEGSLQAQLDAAQGQLDRQRGELEEERRRTLELVSQANAAKQTSSASERELQSSRLQIQELQAGLAEEQADAKHLRDKLKMSQSESGVYKAQLDTVSSELEACKRSLDRVKSDLQEARLQTQSATSEYDALLASTRDMKSALASAQADADAFKQQLTMRSDDMVALRTEVATLRQELLAAQSTLAVAQAKAGSHDADVARVQRALQDAKELSEKHSKRCGELEAECEGERRKSYDLESKLQVASRFEGRYEAEKQRNMELQQRLAELMASESTWRTDRTQLLDVSNKLEAARAEIGRERDENVDLRRKLASQREVEFELRAERDKRVSLEAKLVEADREASGARDVISENSKLKHDKSSLAEELDTIKSELHRTRSVVLDFKEQASRAEVAAREAALKYEQKQQELSFALNETSASLDKERTLRSTSELVIAELKKQLGALKFEAYKVEEQRTALAREREVLTLKQQAAARASAPSPVASPPPSEIDKRELKLLERELEASRMQIEEMRLASVKASTEAEMMRRELDQARLQRKALRASVHRWTDEAAHEKACRVAAEALLKAAAGYTDVVLPSEQLASQPTLSASQQQQLRGVLEAV